MAVSLYQTTQIASGLSATLAHGNYANTDNIKLLELWLNNFIFKADVPGVYAMRWTLVDDKDGWRKIASNREGAVLVDRCAEDWVVPPLLLNQIWQS